MDEREGQEHESPAWWGPHEAWFVTLVSLTYHLSQRKITLCMACIQTLKERRCAHNLLCQV
jgi:hypothetical protein